MTLLPPVHTLAPQPIGLSKLDCTVQLYKVRNDSLEDLTYEIDSSTIDEVFNTYLKKIMIIFIDYAVLTMIFTFFKNTYLKSFYIIFFRLQSLIMIFPFFNA